MGRLVAERHCWTCPFVTRKIIDEFVKINSRFTTLTSQRRAKSTQSGINHITYSLINSVYIPSQLLVDRESSYPTERVLRGSVQSERQDSECQLDQTLGTEHLRKSLRGSNPVHKKSPKHPGIMTNGRSRTKRRDCLFVDLP
jgi:hypothetical protein